MILQPIRVAETSTTTGTGAITLAGALDSGYATFLTQFGAVTTRCWYSIFSSTQWETGVGEFNGSNQLARSQVVRSSNADAAVNFSAGTKTVLAWWPGGMPELGFTASLSASQMLARMGCQMVFAGSANVTCSLPATASTPRGYQITIHNETDDYTVTLDGDASETVGGAATWVINPRQQVTLIRGTGGWRVHPHPNRWQMPIAMAAFSSTGSAPSVLFSQGFSSITRTTTGTFACTFSVQRANTNYIPIATVQRPTNNGIINFSNASIATTGFSLVATQADGTTAVDPGRMSVVVFGEDA